MEKLKVECRKNLKIYVLLSNKGQLESVDWIEETILALCLILDSLGNKNQRRGKLFNETGEETQIQRVEILFIIKVSGGKKDSI